MAVYWNLGLVTRSEEEAGACVAFFEAQRFVQDGVEVELKIGSGPCPGGWVVSVWPFGMAWGSPLGSDERLTTEPARACIAAVFDEWLREAPPFRAALFECEAYDDFLNAGIAEIDAQYQGGLFIDEELWIAVGRPTEALLVCPGRRWWPRTHQP
jgi:hypothetical protein